MKRVFLAMILIGIVSLSRSDAQRHPQIIDWSVSLLGMPSDLDQKSVSLKTQELCKNGPDSFVLGCAIDTEYVRLTLGFSISDTQPDSFLLDMYTFIPFNRQEFLDALHRGSLVKLAEVLSCVYERSYIEAS